MRYLIRVLVILFSCVFISESSALSVQVGTIERPPFAYQENGEWKGFSIDIWEKIASINNYDVTYNAYDAFGDMISETRDAINDLSVANISITLEREKQMDFSYPIYDSGLAMMSLSGNDNKNLYLDVLSDIKFLIYTILTFGLLVMFLLRHKLFPKLKSKKSKPHKYMNIGIILFWGLSVIACFNVTLVSYELNQVQKEGSIRSYEDIGEKLVGVTSGSTSEKFVINNNISYVSFNTINEVYEALKTENIDIMIHDLPVLEYHIKTQAEGIMEIVGAVFQEEKYGIVMPDNSLLKEDINRAILQMRGDGTYESIFERYF